MAQKLYVRRGGGAASETEVMDMVTTRKGAAVFEGQQPLIDMGRRAADGEASQGTFRLLDPEAEVHSTTYRLSPHALVTWTDDSSGDELWLARGRIAPLESGRRAVGIGGDEIEWDVTVNDNNMDLRGQAFTEDWVRPSETDLARIHALRDYTLDGTGSTATHHRSSCNPVIDHDVNGHLVSTAFDRIMPARTYPAGTQPQDVIAECAERSGKTYAIVIHHTGGTSHDCLLYVGALDHATYVTDVKISDQLADIDTESTTAPVFPPIWDRGKGTLTENDDVVSGVVVIYGGTNDAPKSTFVHDPADEAPYEYWVEAINDDRADTADEAANLADTYFTSHRAPGHRTHRFSILMKASQHHLIAAGMSMQVKSAVIAGGPDLGTYVWRRITELRWEPHPDPNLIWAHIDLEKVLRRRGHSFQPTATTPKPPDPGTPGEPPTAPTVDVQWSFTDLGGTDAANLYDDATHSTYRWSGPTWESNSSPAAWHDDYGSPHITWGAAGAKTVPTFPVTAGVDYTFTVDMSQRQSDSNAYLKVQWYNGTTFLQSNYIAGPGVSVAAKASYSKVVTAPATANNLVLFTDAATGEFGAADNIVIAHGGSGGTAGTPSTSAVTTVGGTGSGTYSTSDQYVPVGSVLEHDYITEGGPYHDADQIAIDDTGGYYTGTEVEAALQEIGADLAAVSGGTAELHSHPEYELTATDLTSAPEGGWSIQSTGNIVQYNGYTYIGYEDGVSGDCQIAVVANSDPSTVVNTIVLHAALEADDHDAPALLVRSSDHKLVAAYCVHGGGSMYRRISTTSLDTDPDLGDGFAAESDIDGSLGDSIYTYPTLLELTGESKIYLIYRQGANTDSTWKYSTSSDNGSTWAASTGFLDTGTTGPYMKVVSNGIDRFDIVCIDDEPNTSTPNVYHFYYDGSWRASDGTAGTLTMGTSEMTLVYDGGSVVQRPIDIAYDVQGNPRVLWASFESTSDVRYRYGRWTGSAWVTSTVVASGDTVPAKATNQRGAALDHANGVVVWGVIENADDTGSLYRFTTPDGGDTWESDLIHEGASSGIGDHNPQAVWNADPAIQVVFTYGTFVDFDNYSLGMKTAGLNLVAGEPTADAHIADTTDAHDASAISIVDAGTYYTGTDVEAALQEVAADVAALPTGGIGPILISDTPSTPLVFGDLIQNEAQDDLVYADP